MIRSLFFLCLLVFDIVSKIWAIDNVPPLHAGGYPFGGIPLFHNILGVSFSLNYVVNTGAAWGIFAEYAFWLFIVRFLIIIALSCYVFFFPKTLFQKFFFLLILTGAFGNVLDYFLYGHVIDFFHFIFWGYSFPVFNLADSYITLGVFGLLLFPSRNQVAKDA